MLIISFNTTSMMQIFIMSILQARKLRPLDQQHQHHLGAYQECRTLGPTSDLPKQNLYRIIFFKKSLEILQAFLMSVLLLACELNLWLVQMIQSYVSRPKRPFKSRDDFNPITRTNVSILSCTSLSEYLWSQLMKHKPFPKVGASLEKSWGGSKRVLSGGSESSQSEHPGHCPQGRGRPRTEIAATYPSPVTLDLRPVRPLLTCHGSCWERLRAGGEGDDRG